eukprot:1491188-Pyramimonas_sp.AAC.1
MSGSSCATSTSRRRGEMGKRFAMTEFAPRFSPVRAGLAVRCPARQPYGIAETSQFKLMGLRARA